MKKTKFFVYVFLFLLITSKDISSQEIVGSEEEDKIDFASPGSSETDTDEDNSCETSPHSELLDLLNVKLKKFNPIPEDRRGGEVRGGGNQLTQDEITTNSIRFYAEQLKDVKPVKIRIETFTSLGKGPLTSLIDRSSKVFLKHPTECKFFSLYGDQIIGSYAMTFDNILRLYANAVNKDNQIAQDFIRTQLVPAPMSLDEAIRSLYDDYGYQQNIIESLLPEDVKNLFFGENSLVSIADVAESKLLAFSLLGGKIDKFQNYEIFIVVYAAGFVDAGAGFGLEPTCWTANPLFRIDHVLLNAALHKRCRVVDYRRVDSDASDHYPVVVDLEMEFK